MPDAGDDPNDRRDPTAAWIEVTIRLAVLGLLLYLAFTLILPFITIAIWSIVLTVALYPVYDWMVRHLGGRRRVAAVLLTLISLLVIIGPATWLALGLIDSVGMLSARFDLATLALPPPPETVRTWPLVGEPVYQFWDLASTNLREALARIAPQLKPVGSALLQIAAEAGTGTIKFFIAIFVAGFLFSPAPSLVETMRRFSRRLAEGRGEHFVDLAGATIRTVARGVIGISALQAFLAGIGFMAAGIPGASLLTTAVLVLGILQVGPSIIILPLIIWSWFAMETTAALLFTAWMIPVNLMDNVLRPLVMGRGLSTPMLVILIGVIGGVLSYGITGLFLGPIVLAVIWELLVAWIKEREGVSTPA
ncbi:MAG: AI-2E family transporter [Xanthobacteraceae bacterium]|nr:AI-2E family transporter [Xanthobacteraceae bacterium]